MEILTLENPRWEALTSNTQKAFHLLSNVDIIQDYYLAGGTGLALHLGHRFSVDLDFFSENESSALPCLLVWLCGLICSISGV